MPQELMEPKDIEAYIKRRGFFPTERASSTGRWWRNEEGLCISVPEYDYPVPRWVLDDLIQRVAILR